MKTRIVWTVVVLATLVMETAVLAVPTETPQGTQPAKPRGAPAGKQNPRLPPIGSLPPPEYIPEVARATLRQRMERHGNDMVELLLAVTLLQHDVARKAADRIASEPAIARPEVGGAEESLNAVLPERFFVLQGELRRRAQEVSAAAAREDDKALSAAFSRLSSTCVECHSVYLHPPER